MESSSSGSSTSKRSMKSEASCSSDSVNFSANKLNAKEAPSGKRLKKDDSGINVIRDSESEDSSESTSNTGSPVKVSEENNINKKELNSPDSGNLESCCSTSTMEPKIDTMKTSENENSYCSDMSDESVNGVAEIQISKKLTDENKIKKKLSSLKHKTKKDSQVPSSDIDSSDDSDEEAAGKKREKENSDSDDKYDPTPNTPIPVHRWLATKAVASRQYGHSSKYSPDLFRYQCYGSLHMAQRLELMYKMKKHDGCVNALHFNTQGTKLVTGSDDLDIILWDWTISEPILDYSSGHASNIFQAKFLPLSCDCHIVTCARDGQIRLGELSSAGVCKGTYKLGQHRGAVHRLAIHKDNPHVFLSCGEDGVVFQFDIRASRSKENPQKLITCTENEKQVPLYSVASNPLKPFEYTVGGKNQYVKVYDTRKPGEDCLKKFCPSHLVNCDFRANVTSVVYNYNGEEILASYNEDIYLFDAKANSGSEFLHRYRGHRNSQTVKGVNFFGANSEFVISGSDCGHLFFWEKESEHIVKYMYADEGGVVNCVEPHPHMPILATSGLDFDIKIWVPSCEDPPDLSKLRKHLIGNMIEQEQDCVREGCDEFIDQSILLLMQHLSRARTHQRPVLWSERENRENSNSDTSDSEFQDDDQHPLGCAPS